MKELGWKAAAAQPVILDGSVFERAGCSSLNVNDFIVNLSRPILDV